MRAIASFILIVALPTALAAAESSTITWEIIREAGGPVDSAQRWVQFLQRTSSGSIRIRSANRAVKPQVARRKTSLGDFFTVTAILTSQSRLKVPGGTLELGDLAGLQSWVAGLHRTAEAGDSKSRTAEAFAFGLTADQLIELRRALATPVTTSTRDRPSVEVVAEFQRRSQFAISVDGQARPMLGAQPVLDELKGVGQGTAMAAVLRPLGLSLVPQRRAAGSTVLRIRMATGVDEAWPIGWPSDQPTHRLIPKLMEKLPVEIAEIPVKRVLESLQPRLECPFLIDHNGVAAKSLDLKAKTVSFKSKRTYYKRVLSQILFQAKLQLEVRTDDAGKPFIWIEPLAVD